MRTVIKVLGAVVVLWLVVVLAAWAFQRQIIYLPDAAAPGTPGDPRVEEVTLTTEDDLHLAAWFYPAEDEAVSTILVAPGNAGNRALRAPLAEGLVARGHAVLLVDYRGYGGNAGSPHEEGLIADAHAGRVHLEARDDVDEDAIVYLGESIGSGVATGVAVTEPPAALALRSPFPSLAEVGRSHYPFLPVRTLLRERFEVEEQLAGYDGPLLVVAGGDDSIVPTELSRRVARDAGADYVELDGVDHNDRELLDGRAYLDAVDEFVRTSLGRPGDGG